MNATIVLGGGCFWCLEAVYQHVRGVVKIESGYANGQGENPSYERVCTGESGFNEVVKLSYDPSQVSLTQLLEIFFVIHNPTTLNRQGNDVGTQYRSGFYSNDASEIELCKAFVSQAQAHFPETIVTEIVGLDSYYKAEDYHQDYFNQHPFQGYCMAVVAPKVQKFKATLQALWVD